MPLTAGTCIGTYRIVAPLGSGGMGEVYRANDSKLGRDVALKVLPEAVARDDDRLARFEREARMVAALNHPNIVTLYSIEEIGGVRFLTMEHVDGQSLDRILPPGGLPIGRALDVALALADALAAAHEKGIVHRDLKPGNVMVANDGRVKVLDFGLAKHSAGDVGSSTKTVTSPITAGATVLGTIPYMAPEQLRGEQVDPRSDVFALGIVLYELVSGHRPFRGASQLEVCSAILRDSPMPLTSFRPELPQGLGRIVQRCLEKEPDGRFQSAKELRNELSRLRRELTDAADEPGRGAMTAAFMELSPISIDTPSIAVLPFVNTSKDKENDYFADGLSEELLNVLTRIRGLRVASRTSAFYFKGKDVDLPTVARKLNVAAILEGSVRTAGKRVRITADLIHVATDSRLWSQTYDRELDDIFAVQDDIAQSVVKELRAALLGKKPDASPRESVREEVEAAAKGRGANAEAYRLYLQGRFFVDRYTDASIAKGIAHYQQALALDPEYALAWAGLSVAYASQSRQGFARSAEAFGHAREAAERALQSEPELPEGHLALGLVRMDYDWDWKGAESSVRRALTLAPGNADVVSVTADLMLTLGRLDEAVELSRRAVMLDPLSVTTYKNLGRHCFYAGRLDEAEAALAKMLEISPHCGLAHYLLGYVHLMQGRTIEALAEFEREPIPKFRLLGLALAHHSLGNATRSDEALRELVERESVVAACQIAWAYAHRGDADRAFEWLERGYARRDTPSWLSRHPLLRSLHADSRWQPFLQRMGLAD
jgi:serine/threonine protein kinase